MIDKVTCEESNYLRLLLLLNNICTKVVRAKFNREFHPDKLQKELYRNHKKLKESRSINKGQLNLLFPKSGEASSQTFDVTLMINLLRSLTDLAIGDALPHDNDTSIAAALTRIKWYRNKMCHVDDGRVTDDDFNSYWNHISQAVMTIGGNQYQLTCLSVRDKRLDADPIPIGLQVAHSQMIQNWMSNDDKVIKTNVISDLKDLLNQYNFATLVGASGCGKSTALHYVALEFRQNDYEIVPADTPYDIFEYYNPRKKQFFMYDDVCGRFSLNTQRVEEWSSKSSKIKDLLGKKTIKIVICCRTYIFNNRQFQNVSLLTKTVKQCDVSHEEKIGIAQMYLTEKEVAALKKIPDCINYEFFPLLCQVYLTQSERDVINFFSNPERIIKDDLVSIKDQVDQTIYATLALFAVYNNCINEHLATMENIEEVLNYLARNCFITHILNEQRVKGQLADLTTSYVKKVGNNYSIMHEKLFDILVSFYGENLLRFMIMFSHHDIVRDRYQFASIGLNIDENIITIPECNESEFFKRLQKDMCLNNHVVNVFTNRQLQYSSYRSKFINYVSSNNEVKSYILSLTNKPESPLLIAAANGHHDIVEMMLKFEMNINVKDPNGKTPLYLAVENGHELLVKLLIENKGDTKIFKDESLINLLYVTCAKGYTPVVNILLGFYSDPNICRDAKDFEGETPLYIASKNGHLDVVDLLLKSGSNPNLCKRGLEYEGETPIYIAASMGHTRIVKHLLEYNCEPNVCKLDELHDGETPLFVASEKGYTEIVEHLLIKDADPNMCSRSMGRQNTSCLYVACENGHTIIVDLLLRYKGNPNICRQDPAHDGESPLHVTVEQGNLEIIDLLLNNKNNKCNPNLRRNDENNRGVSPIFIAANKGYMKIVEMLLTKRADPDQVCRVKRPLPQLSSSSTVEHSEVATSEDVVSTPKDMDLTQDVALTPKDVALLHGHNEIVTLFEKFKHKEN